MANARISDRTHRTLHELAEGSGRTIQEIIETAVEAYRRRKFLEECDKAYAALRDDPTAWDEELRERADWDAALGDGLEGY